MATPMQIAAAIRLCCDGASDAPVRVAVAAVQLADGHGFDRDARTRFYALAASVPAGVIADAIDLVRAGTETLDPIDLSEAQDLVADSMGDDGALESIRDSLQCASDCETATDAIMNLREAAHTARKLAAACAELAARIEAGKGA